MSETTPDTSPNGSPDHIQPLHNPSQAAHVVVPQAPLGNVVNQAPGLGAKALLAKKMAKNLSVAWGSMLPIHFLISFFENQQPYVHFTYRQPHDSLHTEDQCSEAETLWQVCHLLAHCLMEFTLLLFRGAKPVQLFAQGEQDEVNSDEKVSEDLIVESEVKIDIDEDENPF
jgi:hypothetical protein